MVTKKEVLEYARECKRLRPQITDDELRAALEAKFMRSGNALPVAPTAAVNNPLHWLVGLISIFRGIGRLWSSSGEEVAAVKEIIEGIIVILREEPVAPSR